MTEPELRVWCEAHAPVGSPQAALVLALLDEVDAYRASAVTARCQWCGWSSSHPDRDAAHAATDAHLRACTAHPIRTVERERDSAQALVRSLSERCSRQSELLSRRAERSGPDCGSQE